MGKVIRPHGRKGLLRVSAYAGPEATFLDVGTFFLRSVSGEVREHAVISAIPQKNFFLLELGGVCSRNEAEEYRGAEVLIRKEDLSREDGEYFWHELLGLRVHLDNGEYLGRIFQILSKGGNDLYVIRDKNKEIFIPATYEVIKEIDLENGKMIISAMEGLLDLNEV